MAPEYGTPCIRMKRGEGDTRKCGTSRAAACAAVGFSGGARAWLHASTLGESAKYEGLVPAASRAPHGAAVPTVEVVVGDVTVGLPGDVVVGWM